MSSDITRIFLSTVRALSSTSIASISGTKERKSRSPEPPSDPSAFSVRARSLHTELVRVRHHLKEAGELSGALATADAVRQRMYHELVKEVNSALDQCAILLKQLQRSARAPERIKKEARTCVVEGEEGENRSQERRHRKAVCKSLEELLKTLQKARDDQVSTYCRRVELAGRLGDSHPSISSGCAIHSRNVLSGGDTGWFFGDYSQISEAISSDFLREGELAQLEVENAETYVQFLSEGSEIKQLSSQISEISRLQAMVTDNLVEQAEMAQRIEDQVVGSTELIREANEQMRQSMDKTMGVRFWLVFILLTLTFSLHFLDWYG